MRNEHTEDFWGNENSGDAAEDTAQAVRKALRDYPGVGINALPTDIGAGDIVVLDGEVDSEQERVECERRAAAISGVARVVNEIRITS